MIAIMDTGKVRVELGERSYDIIFSAVDSPQSIAAFAALPQKNVLITADSNTARYLPRQNRVSVDLSRRGSFQKY